LPIMPAATTRRACDETIAAPDPTILEQIRL
jgi:hypothetical protein